MTTKTDTITRSPLAGIRCTVDGRDGFTIIDAHGSTYVVLHDSVANLPGREGNVAADRVVLDPLSVALRTLTIVGALGWERSRLSPNVARIAELEAALDTIDA